MLLPVDEGEHDIEFVYSTTGFKLGFIISAISISAYVLLIVFKTMYKSRKKKVISGLSKGENVDRKDC